MTTIGRGNQPLNQPCTNGHCLLPTYETGRNPLCWYHRKINPQPDANHAAA